MHRCAWLLLPLALALSLASALRAEEGRAIYDALRLDEIMEVLSDEGQDHAAEIGETLLSGGGDTAWRRAVEGIYAPGRMRGLFLPQFDEELARTSPEMRQEVLAFVSSETGAQIIALEISARRALLDAAVEDEARAAVAAMRDEAPERMALIDRFVESNDLIEENVVGALNASFAFYRGLADSGAPGLDLPEELVLAEVWSQEPAIRTETEEWLFGYLALAYGPLPLEDLEAYVAFSESQAGQRLNTALFLGFSTMFESISREMGRAAGRSLTGSDI